MKDNYFEKNKPYRIIEPFQGNVLLLSVLKCQKTSERIDMENEREMSQ